MGCMLHPEGGGQYSQRPSQGKGSFVSLTLGLQWKVGQWKVGQGLQWNVGQDWALLNYEAKQRNCSYSIPNGCISEK